MLFLDTIKSPNYGFLRFLSKDLLANYLYLLTDLLINVRVLSKEGIPASWILIDLQLIHLDSQQLLSIPGSFCISHGVGVYVSLIGKFS